MVHQLGGGSDRTVNRRRPHEAAVRNNIRGVGKYRANALARTLEEMR
jgi:hypothetical protein